jgi:putative PEP-CTERM system TPR-repeat lipoprotein
MGKVLSFVLSFVLSLLAGFSILDASAATSERVRGYIEDGGKLLESDPAAAAVLFRKAVQNDPGNGDAQFALATALAKSGDLTEVEDHLHAAQDGGHDADEVAAALAEFYVRQGKYGKLLDEIPEGKRRKDLESRIRTARGYAQLNLKQMGDAERAFRQGIAQAQTGLAQTRIIAGDLEGAVNLLQQAADAAPGFTDPWILLGRVRVLRNDPVGARAAFDKALSLSPDSMPALFGRASLLLDSDLKQAAADVASMLDQAPDNWRANLLDAIIKARQERWREAEAALMNIPEPEQLPEALFTLARVNLAQNQIGQADANITRYLAIAPNDPKGLAVKAAVLTARGKPSGAIDLLTTALARMPDNPSLLGLLSDAYTKNNQNKEAAETLDRLSAVAPRDADTRVLLAEQKIAVGRITEALDDLAIARAAEPLSPKAISVTIEALLAANRLDEAVATTEELRRQSPDSAVAETFLGVVEIRRNRTAEARAHFEKALQAQPDFATAAIDLAQTYRVEKRPDDARAAFDRALGRDPKSIPVLMARVDLEIADGKPDAALGFLERARDADPLALPPRFQLVRAYLERKLPAKAVLVAYEIEKIAPRDPKAITAVAEAQLANNDRQTAIHNFERVVDMTSGAPEPLMRLAGVLALGGDIQGGYRAMRRALESNPTELRVQQAMLEFSVKTGTVGASIDFVRELLQRRPDDPNLDLLLGQLYETDRRFERAGAAYEAGFAKRQSSELLRGIARAQAQGPKPATALPTLASWLEKQPDDREARLLYANLLTDAKEFDRAIAECERLRATDPKNPIVLNNLAWLYFLKADGRAMSTADEAYALAPGSPTTADTLGWILVQSGDIQRALPLLRQAAASSPKPVPRYHFAVALSRSGLREDAVRVLTELLDSGASFDDLPAARELRARLGG